MEFFLLLQWTINSFKNPYIMDFGKLLIILAILARKTEFNIDADMHVGAEFTKGAEFSRMYGTTLQPNYATNAVCWNVLKFSKTTLCSSAAPSGAGLPYILKVCSKACVNFRPMNVPKLLKILQGCQLAHPVLTMMYRASPAPTPLGFFMACFWIRTGLHPH